MRTVVSNIIEVEAPTKALTDWVREHLEIPNPEYARRLRMSLWTGNTPSMLYLYQKRDNVLILPFGVLRQIMPYLRDSPLEIRFFDPLRVIYDNPVPLYDYQEKAVEMALRAKYGILQSPAGSGKTQMGIALAQRYARKTLWLTHTQDLLNQSRERALRYIHPTMIGTIANGMVNIGSGITFATIQTMSKLHLDAVRYNWDVIIVDECHRVAGSPAAVTMFYNVLNSLAARHKYGLSATVHRADGMINATYALLGQVIYTVPESAVADKIMRVGIKTIRTNTELSRECLNTDGTLNYTRFIGYLSENSERNRFIGRHIRAEAEHPCLILSDRLEHLETLMNSLPAKLREKAAMISGKMNTKRGREERERAIEDMRTGKKQFLFATYSLAKEGLDIPRLERLIMATPVKDYAVVVQSVGRIARTCEGKQAPVVLDFVDNITYAERCYKQRLRHYKKVGAYMVD